MYGIWFFDSILKLKFMNFARTSQLKIRICFRTASKSFLYLCDPKLIDCNDIFYVFSIQIDHNFISIISKYIQNTQ